MELNLKFPLMKPFQSCDPVAQLPEAGTARNPCVTLFVSV